MGSTKYQFLLDSGAAMSVARLDALDPQWRSQIITENQRTVVGADGPPLDVVGQVVAPLSLCEFQAVYEFTVVRSLITDCILCANFLTRHEAVMDCRTATLSLGDNPSLQVVISVGKEELHQKLSQVPKDIDVILLETTEIPGRTLCQIPIQVDQAPCLVEPLEVISLPKYIVVARTLTTCIDGSWQDTVIQITNTNPTPTTLYKGSKMGRSFPRTTSVYLRVMSAQCEK